jgi:hypothetical protein
MRRVSRVNAALSAGDDVLLSAARGTLSGSPLFTQRVSPVFNAGSWMQQHLR